MYNLFLNNSIWVQAFKSKGIDFSEVDHLFKAISSEKPVVGDHIRIIAARHFKLEWFPELSENQLSRISSLIEGTYRIERLAYTCELIDDNESDFDDIAAYIEVTLSKVSKNI